MAINTNDPVGFISTFPAGKDWMFEAWQAAAMGTMLTTECPPCQPWAAGTTVTMPGGDRATIVAVIPESTKPDSPTLIRARMLAMRNGNWRRR